MGRVLCYPHTHGGCLQLHERLAAQWMDVCTVISLRAEPFRSGWPGPRDTGRKAIRLALHVAFRGRLGADGRGS